MAPHFHMVDVFGTGPVSGNPLAVVAAAGGTGSRRDAADRHLVQPVGNDLPGAADPGRGGLPGEDILAQPGASLRRASDPRQPATPGLRAEVCRRTRRKSSRSAERAWSPIRRSQGRLAFAAPPLIRTGAPSAEELAEARRLLGLEPGEVVDAAWVDNGPGWLGIKLASAERVLALQPAPAWPRPMDVGVVGPYAEGSEAAWELRAFFTDPRGTIVEDPVTGSLNASMAQWLFASGDARGAYVASQGTCLGRRGRIHVSRDPDGRIWIGGATRTQVEGQFVGMG